MVFAEKIGENQLRKLTQVVFRDFGENTCRHRQASVVEVIGGVVQEAGPIAVACFSVRAVAGADKEEGAGCGFQIISEVFRWHHGFLLVKRFFAEKFPNSFFDLVDAGWCIDDRTVLTSEG